MCGPGVPEEAQATYTPVVMYGQVAIEKFVSPPLPPHECPKFLARRVALHWSTYSALLTLSSSGRVPRCQLCQPLIRRVPVIPCDHSGCST